MDDLSIAQCAKALHRTTRTIYTYIKQGKLKAYKVNFYWLIPREAVVAFLEECNGIKQKEEQK